MKAELNTQQKQRLIELGLIQNHREGTLVRLLEILPKEIELDRKPNHFAQLSILYRLERWWVEYQDITLSVRIKEELIDALYELTIWCIENKKL